MTDGVHHPATLSSFQPEDVLTPLGSPGIDLCFIVFIFYFDATWNEITVLQDWLKRCSFPSSMARPHRDPEAVGFNSRERALQFFWHPTSLAKGHMMLAAGRSHHSLMTRTLWCPLDGVSVTHGGKSIRHVWRQWGSLCLLVRSVASRERNGQILIRLNIFMACNGIKIHI